MSGAILSAEDEAALRLCATATRRGDDAAALLRTLERCDADRLEQVLRAQALFALGANRAAKIGRHVLPQRFFERADQLATNTRRASAVQEAVTRRLCSRIESEGIPCLPVKGPLLAGRVHGDPGLRPSADIDLLVGPDEMERALRVLREQGYVGAREERRWNPPDLHLALEHPRGLPPVELHWRLHWYEDRFAGDLLARSHLPADAPRCVEPADEFACLLLFYARDGLAGLRLPADIAAWVDCHPDTLLTPGLNALANKYPELGCALAAAAAAAARVVGIPVTGPRMKPATSRRVALAVGLANWNLRGDTDQVRANISLVDGLLAPAGGTRAFILRQLLLRRRGPLPSGRFAVVRADLVRATHPVKQLVRFALAFWEVRRRRVWSPVPAHQG